MIELRFHHDLYDGRAVDEAAKTYAAFGAMELVREPDGYVVRVTLTPEAAEQGIDEPGLAAELANYALGKTIEQGAGAGAMVPTPDPTSSAGAPR